MTIRYFFRILSGSKDFSRLNRFDCPIPSATCLSMGSNDTPKAPLMTKKNRINGRPF